MIVSGEPLSGHGAPARSDGMDVSSRKQVLVVQTGARFCALPLEIVEEIMRPLPTESIPDMPPFLKGLAIVRGAPLPILDLAKLLGSTDCVPINRFVVVRLDSRRLAVAVESVPGLRELGCALLLSLARILDEADSPLIGAVGVSDQNLLFVLEAGRMVPDGLWQELESKMVVS